jgi:hypothetical protein
LGQKIHAIFSTVAEKALGEIQHQFRFVTFQNNKTRTRRKYPHLIKGVLKKSKKEQM